MGKAIDDRIKDQIVIRTPHEVFRNQILEMAAPSLNDVIEICETFETLKDTSWKERNVGRGPLINSAGVQQDILKSEHLELDEMPQRRNEPHRKVKYGKGRRGRKDSNTTNRTVQLEIKSVSIVSVWAIFDHAVNGGILQINWKS
ncbi:hypothetical protein ACOME3_010678 [Neoechinorhynchus agilis]